MHRKLIRFLAAAALAFAALGAHAQTRVTNCNDSGPGSLRVVAESAPNLSWIELRSLPCDRIVLTTGPIRLSQYFIGFQGPGWTQLTVSGDGRSQVFVHTPPPPIPFEGGPGISLRGFTVSWGRALDEEAFGGCIFGGGFVSLANMQVHHCIARDTRTGGNAGFGGAVFGNGVGVNYSRIHTNRAIGGNGGGVFSLAGVGVQSSNISNNTASGDGGGFEALQGTRVELSNITSNVAGGRGGGMSVTGESSPGGLIWIIRSTVARNRAHTAAAARFFSGNSTRVIQSTVSNNVADESQGGLLFDAPFAVEEVINSTVTANRALAAGAAGCVGNGVSMRGSVGFVSSIVSANTCAGLPDDIGSAGDPNLSGAGGDNNLIGTSSETFFGEDNVFTSNPRLGALANNGGRTQTHLPLADSPAIDAGNNRRSFATDQRSGTFVRVKGAAADIGSVER